MAACEDASSVYFAVSNIPVTFHTVDLRNYFSQFIESGGFQCFHYRHRPEILRESEVPRTAAPGEEAEGRPEGSESDRRANASAKKRSCCCVALVHDKHAGRFARMYAGNHWIDSKGNWLSRRCVIRRVKVSNDEGE